MFLLDSVHIYHNYLTFYVYVLLIITCFFKKTLKYFARKVDVLNKLNPGNHHTSLEIVTELMINSIYFGYYYYYLLVELSSMDKRGMLTFAKITSLHVSSEMLQSFIRFSHLYFKYSQCFIDCITNNNNAVTCRCQCVVRVQRIVERFLVDDSSFTQWRIRHCIDMSTRVMAMICQIVIVITYAAAVGANWFDLSVSQFYNGLWYCLISFLIDMVYFISVWAVHRYSPRLAKCNKAEEKSTFNVFGPIINMYWHNFKGFVYLSVCAFLMQRGIRYN